MSHPVNGLTHVDAQGNANMVDVTDKMQNRHERTDHSSYYRQY